MSTAPKNNDDRESRDAEAVAALIRLGTAVRAQRESLGLSQEALAERSGHHRNFIGGLERGEQNVSYLGLLKLSEALGCTLASLIERST